MVNKMISILSLFVLVASVASVAAGSHDEELFGVIVGIGNNDSLRPSITVLSSQQKTFIGSYFITAKTQITKDGIPCTLINLMKGDLATIVFLPKHRIATTIRASSKQLGDLSSGIIKELSWDPKLNSRLEVSLLEITGKERRLNLDERTSVEINGRSGKLRELQIGDLVDIASSERPSKLLVLRLEEPIEFRCVLKKIQVLGFEYLFFVESITPPIRSYSLIVTAQSKLYRNGRTASAAEFRPRDFGVARFYISDLRLITFKARSSQ